MSSRDWDAATYDRISAPQQAWAAEQLERLELAGDEVVVDAGCGSGKVTAELVRRVPRGTVYAVDVAPSMVRFTAQALGDTVTALCQDLTELDLPEPVDVVFSNATFHWIGDHDALFAALARSMKPGARLLAQCGGRGNIDFLRTTADRIAAEQPFAPYFADWQRPWNYATDTDTARRLDAAGFEEISCWLEPKRVTPEDAPTFLRTVCLIRHMDPLPEQLQTEFVERVLACSGDPLVLEYVRLNMSAVRI
jgi:trans-aconitate 2-methyltransferase